jgi:hypothetical protein
MKVACVANLVLSAKKDCRLNGIHCNERTIVCQDSLLTLGKMVVYIKEVTRFVLRLVIFDIPTLNAFTKHLGK